MAKPYPLRLGAAVVLVNETDRLVFTFVFCRTCLRDLQSSGRNRRMELHACAYANAMGTPVLDPRNWYKHLSFGKWYTIDTCRNGTRSWKAWEARLSLRRRFT